MTSILLFVYVFAGSIIQDAVASENVPSAPQIPGVDSTLKGNNLNHVFAAAGASASSSIKGPSGKIMSYIYSNKMPTNQSKEGDLVVSNNSAFGFKKSKFDKVTDDDKTKNARSPTSTNLNLNKQLNVESGYDSDESDSYDDSFDYSPSSESSDFDSDEFRFPVYTKFPSPSINKPPLKASSLLQSSVTPKTQTTTSEPIQNNACALRNQGQLGQNGRTQIPAQLRQLNLRSSLGASRYPTSGSLNGNTGYPNSTPDYADLTSDLLNRMITASTLASILEGFNRANLRPETYRGFNSGPTNLSSLTPGNLNSLRPNTGGTNFSGLLPEASAGNPNSGLNRNTGGTPFFNLFPGTSTSGLNSGYGSNAGETNFPNLPSRTTVNGLPNPNIINSGSRPNAEKTGYSNLLPGSSMNSFPNSNLFSNSKPKGGATRFSNLLPEASNSSLRPNTGGTNFSDLLPGAFAGNPNSGLNRNTGETPFSNLFPGTSTSGLNSGYGSNAGETNFPNLPSRTTVNGLPNPNIINSGSRPNAEKTGYSNLLPGSSMNSFPNSNLFSNSKPKGGATRFSNLLPEASNSSLRPNAGAADLSNLSRGPNNALSDLNGRVQSYNQAVPYRQSDGTTKLSSDYQPSRAQNGQRLNYQLGNGTPRRNGQLDNNQTGNKKVVFVEPPDSTSNETELRTATPQPTLTTPVVEALQK